MPQLSCTCTHKYLGLRRARCAFSRVHVCLTKVFDSVAAGLWVQWRVFGSSGHVGRPQPGGPLEHFTACAPRTRAADAKREDDDPGSIEAFGTVTFGKAIANTHWATRIAHSHNFRYMCACALLPVAVLCFGSSFFLAQRLWHGQSCLRAAPVLHVPVNTVRSMPVARTIVTMRSTDGSMSAAEPTPSRSFQTGAKCHQNQTTRTCGLVSTSLQRFRSQSSCSRLACSSTTT